MILGDLLPVPDTLGKPGPSSHFSQIWSPRHIIHSFQILNVVVCHLLLMEENDDHWRKVDMLGKKKKKDGISRKLCQKDHQLKSRRSFPDSLVQLTYFTDEGDLPKVTQTVAKTPSPLVTYSVFFLPHPAVSSILSSTSH